GGCFWSAMRTGPCGSFAMPLKDGGLGGTRGAASAQPGRAAPVTSGQTTVVIPAWDEYVGELLPEALASLRRQSASPEIVDGDNASAISIGHPAGVTVLRAPRRLRLGEARNFALARVKSPYVV